MAARLTARKDAALRPAPGVVSVAHVPDEPVARIEHRLACIERAHHLAWHHTMHGLEGDVEKVAAILTTAQREALVEWLRWEEWHQREIPGKAEPLVLASCRKRLGDHEPVSFDKMPHRMRPFGRAETGGVDSVVRSGNVIDLMEALKRSLARHKGEPA